MGYFAKIKDGIVESVVSINNSVLGEPSLSFPETEKNGIDFILNNLFLHGEWKQTSFNGNFRKNYAGIGYSYDPQRDAFIPAKPYPSWIFNEQLCIWDAPVPYPDDGKKYDWDDETISWKEIINDPI